jgi:hypothetical protein
MKWDRVRQVSLRAVVALSLAFLIWLYGRSRYQESIDDVLIPVHIALAAEDQNQHELEVTGPSRVVASFSGPPALMRELRGQLQRGLVQVSITLTVPEDKQNEGFYRDVARIDAKEIPAPAGVTVCVSQPNSGVSVTVHKIVERRIAVRLQTMGEGRIAQLKLEPPTVLVRGRQDVIDQTRAVPTVVHALPVAPETGTSEDGVIQGEIALAKELDGHAIQCTPATVAFRGRLHPRQRTYDLVGLPVSFLCPPDFPWRPRFARPEDGLVSLRVTGPTLDEPPQVQVFVDLTQGKFESGKNREPVRLQLPKDFQAAAETPRLVTFYLVPQ